jgi:hypothetical protein
MSKKRSWLSRLFSPPQPCSYLKLPPLSDIPSPPPWEKRPPLSPNSTIEELDKHLKDALRDISVMSTMTNINSLDDDSIAIFEKEVGKLKLILEFKKAKKQEGGIV